MTFLLNTIFTKAHAAVLEAHAPPAATRASAVAPPAAVGAPEASASAAAAAMDVGDDGLLDPAIASFKSLIASQDAELTTLRDELAQLREQHSCVQTELESARAVAVRAETHRQQAQELTEARDKAERESRTAREELARLRVQGTNALSVAGKKPKSCRLGVWERTKVFAVTHRLSARNHISKEERTHARTHTYGSAQIRM